MRKLVILTVVLALVLGIAGVASAAVTQDQAANKLQGLGIVQGDEGGLRLGDNITRAEFAKVAVYLAGMEKSADLLKNTPSQFSDVKVGEWYTGWINLAASQGYVKGDPNGTFRPNDKITYAEVITVLLRILGYNDNLPGTWPVEYLAKAAALGITNDVTFDATAAAVRGNVFILANATLDENIVTYSKDKDAFEEGTKTLLAKNFDSSVKKGIVELVKMNKNDVQVVINVKDTNIASQTYTLKSNAYVSGASDIFGAEDMWAEYVLDKDGKITYIGLSPLTLVSVDPAKYNDGSWNGSEVKFDGKRYDIASGDFTPVYYKNFTKDSTVTAEVYFGNDTNSNTSGYEEGFVAGLDALYLVQNQDGDVVAFKGYDYGSSVADDVTVNRDKTKIYFKQGTNSTVTVDTDDETYLVVKDGAKANLTDIKENDVVFYQQDGPKGVKHFFMVSSKKQEGTISLLSANSKSADITVGGTKLKASGDIYWYDKDTKTEITGGFADYIGGNALVLLDFNGKARYIATAKTDSTQAGILAVVRGGVKIEEASGSNYYLRFTSAAGDVSYQITNDTKYEGSKKNASAVVVTEANGDGIADNAGFAAGDIVELKLTSDGKLASLYKKNNATASNRDSLTSTEKDNDRITLDVGDRKVNDSTLILVADGGLGKYKKATWKQVENISLTAPNNADFVAYVDGAYVKVLVVAGDNGSGTYLAADSVVGAASKDKAVLTGTAYGADGLQVTLLLPSGESKTYETSDNSVLDFVYAKNNTIQAKDLVSFELNSKGEVKSVSALVYTTNSGVGVDAASLLDSGTVYKVDSESITLKDNNVERIYFFASGVVVFDVTASKASDASVVTTSGIRKDQTVYLIKGTGDDASNVKYVVIR